MVSFKNLCEYKNENDKLKKKNHRKLKLNVFDRIRLGRTEELIHQITSKIERESGWEYLNGSFVYPNHFSLNGNDISFDVNRVNVGGNDLDALSLTSITFMLRYGPLLKRLKELEAKRSQFMLPDDIPSTEDYRTDLIMRKARHGMDDYLSRTFTQFLLAFPKVGAEGLVDALNMVHDASNNQEAYDEFIKKYQNGLLRKELLSWISSFSRRGNILFEQYQHNLVAAQIKREVKGVQPIMHDESEAILRIYNK